MELFKAFWFIESRTAPGVQIKARNCSLEIIFLNVVG
jgi:hypothetical protein